MQRKFVTNLALVLFLNLLVKVYWLLGIEVAVQNAVKPELYGFYYAIFSFSFLFNILLDLGITTFNNKNISQNNHLLSKHLSSIILLRLLLAGIFSIVTIIGGLIIGYNTDLMKMLIAVVFNQILISFIFYLRSNLAGLHLFKTDSIISVLDRFIMIILCSILLFNYKQTGEFDIRLFIYAQTTAYLITTIVTLSIVMKKARIKKLQWRWPFFLMILKKSYPYAVLVLLMTFYTYSNGPMLERLLGFRVGAYAAGIYASANRLLDATNMIAVLFAGLLLPIFARMIKLKQNVEELVRLSFSLLIIPAIILSCCCYFFSYEIMDKLYEGAHIEESAAVFRLLICCFIPISSVYIFGTLLTANGNLRQLNIMASLGMLLNIILNFLLIPKFSAVGAAISSVITQTLTAITQILMAQKVFAFRKNYRLLLTIFIFIICVIGINIFISGLSFNWVSRFILSVSTCFAFAFATRLISIRNIYRIVKYEDA
jgi:O-antigen/teichoic acid export membrane protein